MSSEFTIIDLFITSISWNLSMNKPIKDEFKKIDNFKNTLFCQQVRCPRGTTVVRVLSWWAFEYTICWELSEWGRQSENKRNELCYGVQVHYRRVSCKFPLIPSFARPINLLIYSRFSRRLAQSHYDVLKVKPDCSHQEIRDAFVLQSKLVNTSHIGHVIHSRVFSFTSSFQFHPDGQKGNSLQFGKVMEAYKVLGKEETRQSYDYERSAGGSFGGNHINFGMNHPNRFVVPPLL